MARWPRLFRRRKKSGPEVITSVVLRTELPSKPITPEVVIPTTAATLLRDDVRPDVIRGTLALKGETFHVLERPWLDNRRNESCIPAGTYRATFMKKSASGKYRNVFWLQSVPGRSAILIHNGNTVNHSRGCLIIGKRRGPLAGQPAVLNSKTALREFAALLDSKPFTLTIIGDQKL